MAPCRRAGSGTGSADMRRPHASPRSGEDRGGGFADRSVDGVMGRSRRSGHVLFLSLGRARTRLQLLTHVNAGDAPSRGKNMLAATFDLEAIATVERLGVDGRIQGELRKSVPARPAFEFPDNHRADTRASVCGVHVEPPELVSAGHDRSEADRASGGITGDHGFLLPATDAPPQ